MRSNETRMTPHTERKRHIGTHREAMAVKQSAKRREIARRKIASAQHAASRRCQWQQWLQLGCSACVSCLRRLSVSRSADTTLRACLLWYHS